MSNTIAIGVDPGASGGIAFINGDEVLAIRMPETEADILEVLGWYPGERKFAVLESVHAGPKMASSAAFKFGCGFGGLRMALIANKIPHELVSAVRWQKEMGLVQKGRKLGEGDSAKKQAAKRKAQELYPSIKVTHAIADALLLATFCKRTYGK